MEEENGENSERLSGVSGAIRLSARCSVVKVPIIVLC